MIVKMWKEASVLVCLPSKNGDYTYFETSPRTVPSTVKTKLVDFPTPESLCGKIFASEWLASDPKVVGNEVFFFRHRQCACFDPLCDLIAEHNEKRRQVYPPRKFRWEMETVIVPEWKIATPNAEEGNLLDQLPAAALAWYEKEVACHVQG